MEANKPNKSKYDIIQSQLVTRSIEYCKRFMELNNSENKSTPDSVTSSIVQLSRLKLLNSLNYRELNAIRNMYLNEAESSDNFHLSMNVYKELRSHFPSMIIMSYEDFNDIMETYNLTNVRSDDFTGSIPNENIRDLSYYMDVISSLKLDDYLSTKRIINSISLKSVFKSYYINRIEYTSNSLFRREFDFIIDSLTKRSRVIHDSVSEYIINKLSEFIGISNEKATEFYEMVVKRHFDIATSYLSYSDVFIACPKDMTVSCVTKNEKIHKSNTKLSKIARDPIANIYTPIGMGIITSWGRESHDEVLVKYKTELGIL